MTSWQVWERHLKSKPNWRSTIGPKQLVAIKIHLQNRSDGNWDRIECRRLDLGDKAKSCKARAGLTLRDRYISLRRLHRNGQKRTSHATNFDAGGFWIGWMEMARVWSNYNGKQRGMPNNNFNSPSFVPFLYLSFTSFLKCVLSKIALKPNRER